MSGPLKKTTGLTGLLVAQNPHKSLEVLYQKILGIISRMPADAHYRQSTQILIEERLAAVKAEPNVEKLEDKINGGQVEELMLQAERELTLARKMLDWKPWQPLVGQAPPQQWKWPI